MLHACELFLRKHIHLWLTELSGFPGAWKNTLTDGSVLYDFRIRTDRYCGDDHKQQGSRKEVQLVQTLPAWALDSGQVEA